jgi:hypothetical protein
MFLLYYSINGDGATKEHEYPNGTLIQLNPSLSFLVGL